LFVHLPSNDNVGHADGWASKKQLATLANADKCIGAIIKAYADEKLDGSTCFLITADHGGFGRQHGPDDVRCRYIPWICMGPGVRQDNDLTGDGNLTIDTEDSFCTICYLLGIPVEKKVDGKPIKEIVDRKELLGAP
jgi:arylsulfatase A-like enzyme